MHDQAILPYTPILAGSKAASSVPKHVLCMLQLLEGEWVKLDMGIPYMVHGNTCGRSAHHHKEPSRPTTLFQPPFILFQTLS